MSDPDGNAADCAMPDCADAARVALEFAPLSSLCVPELAELLRPALSVEQPLDAIVLPDEAEQSAAKPGRLEEPLDAIVLPDEPASDSPPIPTVLRIGYVELPPMAVASEARVARTNMLWGAAIACGIALAVLLNVEPAVRPSLKSLARDPAATRGTGSVHADALGANFTATRCGYATGSYESRQGSRCVLEGTLEALGDEMRTRGHLLHEQAIRQSAVRATAIQPLPPVDYHAQGSP